MLAATPVLAATDKPQDTRNQASGQKKPADVRSAKEAEKAWEQDHRASKIIGADIVNAKGEKVGTVKDLVLDDPASGKVTRVVVSVGGLGGLGDKLFAVPYSELQRDQKKNALVLNQDSDLANSFKDDNWQALADQTSSNGANASAAAPGSSGSSASAPSTDTTASTPSSNASASTSSSNASATTPSNSTSGSTSPGSTSSSSGTSTVIGAPSAGDTSTMSPAAK